MRFGLNHLDKEGVIQESKIIEEKEGKDVAVIKTVISKLYLKWYCKLNLKSYTKLDLKWYCKFNLKCFTKLDLKWYCKLHLKGYFVQVLAQA